MRISVGAFIPAAPFQAIASRASRRSPAGSGPTHRQTLPLGGVCVNRTSMVERNGASFCGFSAAAQTCGPREADRSDCWPDVLIEGIFFPGYMQRVSFERSKAVNLILILIVLILLFGGGGVYIGAPYHYFGGGVSLLLLIVVLILLFSRAVQFSDL